MDLPPILERAALLHGSEEAVVCGDVAWSYDALRRESEAFGRGLAASGLGPGARVAILHGNCHRFLQAALGAAHAGAVLVPLNTRLDARSLGEQLLDCGARLLLAEPETDLLARHAVAAAGGSPRIARVEEIAASGAASGAGERPRVSADDPAQIYYTSGTTGRPRGAVLLHRNVASHALMAIAELGLTDADTWAHAAPMFHLADAWAVFAITWVGGRHAMFPRFDPSALLDGFERHGVTITNLVPTMLNRLVAEPGVASRRFPALRALLSGGAPISPALVEKVTGVFGARYVQTYGLTETSPYLTFSTPSRRERSLPESERVARLARTGRPALGVSLRVVDEGGADAPRDDRTVGEIWVKAPWVTPGYWNRPAETAAAFADGWFKTGDLATWNAEGSVRIVDRKKDLIITGGEKVFSVEVEAALAAHPAVFESAVVGVPDPDWGERVTAAVVLRPDRSASVEELAAHLAVRLASFKIPKRFVFVGELPKTGSGKILKRELRDRLARA